MTAHAIDSPSYVEVPAKKYKTKHTHIRESGEYATPGVEIETSAYLISDDKRAARCSPQYSSRLHHLNHEAISFINI